MSKVNARFAISVLVAIIMVGQLEPGKALKCKATCPLGLGQILKCDEKAQEYEIDCSAPTTPEPTQPSSSTAEPTQPSSSTREPTEPPSSTAEPTQPSSSTREPTQPSSSTTEPTQSSSSPTGPTQPSSSTTEPIQSSSSPTGPTQPSSSTTEPTQPSSSTTEPTQPSSSTTEPTQSSSSTTEPTQPSSSTTEPTQSSSSTTEPTQSSSSTTESEQVEDDQRDSYRRKRSIVSRFSALQPRAENDYVCFSLGLAHANKDYKLKGCFKETENTCNTLKNAIDSTEMRVSSCNVCSSDNCNGSMTIIANVALTILALTSVFALNK